MQYDDAISPTIDKNITLRQKVRILFIIIKPYNAAFFHSFFYSSFHSSFCMRILPLSCREGLEIFFKGQFNLKKLPKCLKIQACIQQSRVAGKFTNAQKKYDSRRDLGMTEGRRGIVKTITGLGIGLLSLYFFLLFFRDS